MKVERKTNRSIKTKVFPKVSWKQKLWGHLKRKSIDRLLTLKHFIFLGKSNIYFYMEIAYRSEKSETFSLYFCCSKRMGVVENLFFHWKRWKTSMLVRCCKCVRYCLGHVYSMSSAVLVIMYSLCDCVPRWNFPNYLRKLNDKIFLVFFSASLFSVLDFVRLRR